jgi:hypothetical protein
VVSGFGDLALTTPGHGRARNFVGEFLTLGVFFRFSEVGTPAALEETLPRWLIVGKEVLSANVAANTAFVVELDFCRHFIRCDASLKRRVTLVTLTCKAVTKEGPRP